MFNSSIAQICFLMECTSASKKSVINVMFVALDLIEDTGEERATSNLSGVMGYRAFLHTMVTMG